MWNHAGDYRSMTRRGKRVTCSSIMSHCETAGEEFYELRIEFQVSRRERALSKEKLLAYMWNHADDYRSVLMRKSQPVTCNPTTHWFQT